METGNNYKWEYVSLGGVVRIKIRSGEDIAHLGELDQKKWTTLSCPVGGLEFDRKTLEMLDADKDGKIRVTEVVEAAGWLTSVIKDKDLILKGDSSLPLDQIDTDCEDGKLLYDSAKNILASLGKEEDSISIEDSSDSVAIFGGTKFNGDGVITEASADDDALKKVIAACVASVGGVTDRNGQQGVTAELTCKFYDECAAYSAWQAAAETDKAAIFPYGDGTAAALDACNALKDKVNDYFMRCKLINFNESAAGALDVSVDRIGGISDKNLSLCTDEIATYPLARPGKECKIPFDGINPAWKGAFDNFRSLVLGDDFKDKDGISEDEWNAVFAKFGPYTAWMGAKAGSSVETLGLEFVNGVLADGSREKLLELVDKDNSFKPQADAIDAVDKLMHLYRNFYHFLCNYVVFTDFYGRNDKVKAVFEAGKLYIDERCCNLCLKVEGPGNHAEAASLSGMFLIYCTCTSKKLGKTMNIVAVMTDGGIKNLRPGKNAIFYDLEGNDWDAVVTKIVDNPISIKQAFWSPYRKLAKFINDKIDKSAAEKDQAATSALLAKADAPAGEKKLPFDIGKFMGIIAALSVALAGIGVALKSLVQGIASLQWWQILFAIAAIMLVISGPACFIAWKKLRKRDLGPVLNASGWAINSNVIVNILFGKTLTSIAKYPLVKGKDPFKAPKWKAWVRGIIAAIVIAFAIMYFTDNLNFMGIHRAKKAQTVETEVVEAAPEAVEAVAE